MKKDFLSITDVSLGEIQQLFALTGEIKKQPKEFQTMLTNKTVVMIFEKPSNRTRVSFEVGIWQLGGHSIVLNLADINLGVREAIKDVARTLSRYADAIILRTFSHKKVEELASFASVPVINALTDLLHPCQGLSDIYTIKEKLSEIKGKTIAYVGDGNNVCNSLLHICAKVGANLAIATPKRFEPQAAIVKEALTLAKESASKISLLNNAKEAVKDADVIYTDVWASMGQEKEAAKRKKIFKDFQVNSKLVALAKKNTLIMHCMPAHRGDEITDEVIDSKQSIVFDQAENRLHVQKAILIKLLKGK
jgi:ornithine carbamoyltransferase